MLPSPDGKLIESNEFGSSKSICKGRDEGEARGRRGSGEEAAREMQGRCREDAKERRGNILKQSIKFKTPPALIVRVAAGSLKLLIPKMKYLYN